MKISEHEFEAHGLKSLSLNSRQRKTRALETQAPLLLPTAFLPAILFRHPSPPHRTCHSLNFTLFSLMMATAVVNVEYVAASFAVPQPTLQSLLDNPTVELVTSLLQQIEAKAREHDEIKAEKLRSDVELENSVRSGDSRARALKASVDKGLKEVGELRTKLNDEGMSCPLKQYAFSDRVHLCRKRARSARDRASDSQVFII